MPGVIGYIGKDLASLRCVLTLEGARVQGLRTPFGGWGLIYYRSGDILLKSHPFSSMNIEGFLHVLGEAETDTFLGRFESPSAPPPGKWNMQPFRYRGWVYVQQGRIQGFNRIRENVIASMPDFLGRSLKGTSDAEAIFHLILSFLYDAGKLDVRKMEAQTIVRAVRHTLEFLGKMAAEHDIRPQPVSLLVSNGTLMAGYNANQEARLAVYEGRGQCEGCSLKDTCKLLRYNESTRAAIVVILRQFPGPLRGEPFMPIQPDSFFVISRDITVESIPGRVSMF
jgi:hypothetical protein